MRTLIPAGNRLAIPELSANSADADRMVAVGTRISPRPPRRSRRALLTHRAPPSGSGVEAVTRQRVYRSDWRKEAGDELDEPLPAEACRVGGCSSQRSKSPLRV